jgi:hypothetical protein
MKSPLSGEKGYIEKGRQRGRVIRKRTSVLEERVNHGIALSSRDEVDRKKRRAADTIHFLFP